MDDGSCRPGAGLAGDEEDVAVEDRESSPEEAVRIGLGLVRVVLAHRGGGHSPAHLAPLQRFERVGYRRRPRRDPIASRRAEPFRSATPLPTDGINSEPEGLEPPANNIDTAVVFDLIVDGTTRITDQDGYYISGAGTPPHAEISYNDRGGVKDKWVYLGRIPNAGSMTVNQSFVLDCATTNWAQGDTMTFTEIFYALQSEGDTAPPALTPELPGFTRVWP